MSRSLVGVCIGLAGFVAGAAPTAADELLEKLQAIPGMTVVNEQPTRVLRQPVPGEPDLDQIDRGIRHRF